MKQAMQPALGATCDHCTKKDCEDCVKENGKNFCCEHCCADFKQRQEKPTNSPVNVCKFC